MFNTTKTLMAVSLIAFTSACATKPENIQGTYTSSAQYDGKSCNWLIMERNEVVRQVNTLTASQSKKATNDAIAMGVGVILFWPALFALGAGSDQEAQLASAKGQYDALTVAMDRKGCGP